jgi:hypothetical protein
VGNPYEGLNNTARIEGYVQARVANDTRLLHQFAPTVNQSEVGQAKVFYNVLIKLMGEIAGKHVKLIVHNTELLYRTDIYPEEHMRYTNELLAAQRVVGPCMDECQLAKIEMVEGKEIYRGYSHLISLLCLEK